MNFFCIISGIFICGIFLVWLGIMVRLGRLRWYFLNGSFPVLSPLGSLLIAIPLGLGVISIGLMMIFPGSDWGFLMLFFVIATAILGFWMPDWIQPGWLHWLNDNYGHVLGQMFNEARQMGCKKWEEETRTKESLERWADNVAHKHGWRRHSK